MGNVLRNQLAGRFEKVVKFHNSSPIFACSFPSKHSAIERLSHVGRCTEIRLYPYYVLVGSRKKGKPHHHIPPLCPSPWIHDMLPYKRLGQCQQLYFQEEWRMVFNSPSRSSRDHVMIRPVSTGFVVFEGSFYRMSP